MPEEIEWTILRRTELPTWPTPEKPVMVYAVTYQADLMPPRTIYIPKEEWSQEEEDKRILEDIARVRAQRPERRRGVLP